MDYEIEFKMIEIKDISKIQKRERVKDSALGTETTQISNITDEYCKLVMNQVGLLMDLEHQIKYIGCIDRIGNFEFSIAHDTIEYVVIFQQDTYEWNTQLTIKIGYAQSRNGLPAEFMKEKLDGYDYFLERIKLSIKNVVIRDWYKCVWISDMQSLMLSREVYAEIYMAENELRAFISKVMIEHFGIDWNDRPEFYKLNASIKENSANIRRNVPSFDNIDINLYTVTLETLMETVKADIYSDTLPEASEIQRTIKEKVFATTHLDKMQSALAYLKNRYVKKYNIWEKYFLPLVSEPEIWEKSITSFIENRNHVAHNKLLDYAAKVIMLDDTRNFRRYIQEAVTKFDKEIVSEEVEETIQAIIDQREYERESLLEIIESETGVKIRNKSEIVNMFQNTIDDIYSDMVNRLYFSDKYETGEENNLQIVSGDQLLFVINSKGTRKLEIYGIIEVDDSEGASSTLQIKVFGLDKMIANEQIDYVNGAAEYDTEQANYMPVIKDEYNDKNMKAIKKAIENFLSDKSEDEEILRYDMKRKCEEDWKADVADMLEGK